MISLLVNKSDLNWNWGTLGLNEMIGYLVNSGKFEVGYHDEKINIDRGYRATILVVNGKRIYVDFWEYGLPTYSNKVADANFDLIIKLQHKQMTDDELLKTCRRKNMLSKLSDDEKKAFVKKIVPWSFFPSKMLSKYVGKSNMETLPIERDGFFCGKQWKCRHKILKHLESQGIEFLRSDRLVAETAINDNMYLHMMKTSRYGIVLGGRASGVTECKNRREIDYMILNKPLLLNYKPYYYDPLIEGKHYAHIDINTNLKDLSNKYDFEYIVKNASEWYNNNASPEGVVKSFIKIISDRLII